MSKVANIFNDNLWACLWQWQKIRSVVKRPIENVLPEMVPDSLRQTVALDLTCCIQPHKNIKHHRAHFISCGARCGVHRATLSQSTLFLLCQGQQCNYRDTKCYGFGMRLTSFFFVFSSLIILFPLLTNEEETWHVSNYLTVNFRYFSYS